MFIIGAIITMCAFIATGNTTLTFSDVVVGEAAMYATNKAIETQILYGVMLAGILAYGLYTVLSAKKSSGSLMEAQAQSGWELLMILLSIVTFGVLLWGTVFRIYFVFFLVAAAYYFTKKGDFIPAVVVPATSIYCIVGIYRVAMVLGWEQEVSNRMVAAGTLVLSLVPILFKDSKKFLYRMIMVESAISVFGILCYDLDKYRYAGSIITISNPIQMRVLVYGLILVLFGCAVYGTVREWNAYAEGKVKVFVGSCVAAMCYNGYSGTGRYMTTDLHHPFEDIIGFTEIFQRGQTPFTEYTPISGMYSVVHGAIFQFFGNGEMANLYMCENVLYLLLIVVTILLLKRFVSDSYLLLISVTCGFVRYNRVAFILPIMLLLLSPQLIQKRNRWLMAWFLTSLFHGLYYPIYGAATCLAFAPMGIYLLVGFIRSGELKAACKTKSFWIGWGICALLLIAAMPLLIGTLRHMLAMSGQSTMSDGVARFGSMIPETVLPYLNGLKPVIRMTIYYGLLFMGWIAFVWLAVIIAANALHLRQEARKWKVENPIAFCSFLAVGIMAMVSYSFAFNSAESGTLFSRATGVIIYGIICITVLTYRYIPEVKTRCGILFLSFAWVGIMATSGLGTIENNYLTYCVSVPEDIAIPVKNDPTEFVGEGFLVRDTYNRIYKMKEQAEKLDIEHDSFLGALDLFGGCYLVGSTGDGTVELAGANKSFDAANEQIEIAKRCGSVLGMENPPLNYYYLYRYMMASGDYVYDSDAQVFYPNDAHLELDQVHAINREASLALEETDMGKIASSWGASMEVLSGIFAEVDATVTAKGDDKEQTLVFSREVYGDEADFLFIDYEVDLASAPYNYVMSNAAEEVAYEDAGISSIFMRKNYYPGVKVVLTYTDDAGESHIAKASLHKGKLLIPLGACDGWLLDHHSSIELHMEQDSVVVDMPEIVDVRLLKLREAGVE